MIQAKHNYMAAAASCLILNCRPTQGQYTFHGPSFSPPFKKDLLLTCWLLLKEMVTQSATNPKKRPQELAMSNSTHIIVLRAW